MSSSWDLAVAHPVPAGLAGPSLPGRLRGGLHGGLHGPPRFDLAVLWSAVAAGPDGTSPGGPRGSLSPDEAARLQALITLAQRGDAEAFGQLYERYVEVVYRYIFVRVGQVHTAQDLTSDTFVKALRNIGTFTWQGKDIAAWFVTIARNVVNDHTKSAKFRMEVTTADMLDADQQVDAPEGEVLDRIRDERLLEAVKALKPEQAECVVLRFIDGLSIAETAVILGKKENAVKQLQLRAVRSLQRALEGETL